jgi:broad specificity phosphatase PhoE
MAMPQDLLLVRHGQSEGNIVQRAFKDGDGMEIPDQFMQTHDWQYRLTDEGVEQAKAAGAWLVEKFGALDESFDERYVSPYIRTRETALHIGGPACRWLIDDNLPERDWGLYNSVSPAERAELFKYTERMREISPLRWRPDGGEALMSEVRLRFRDWLDTLHREQADKRVIAVTHGELIWVARYVIERMLPEEWEEAENDKTQRVYNCDIIWYSRVNPTDPKDVSKALSWRKIVRPTDQGAAPFNGEWVKLNGKRRFSGAQLAETVNAVPRVFPSTNVIEGQM